MAPNFPQEEYAGRVQKLQDVLRSRDIGVAVINTPENVCYLTGHETPGYYTYQCLIVPAEGEVTLLMRITETVNAREFTYVSDVVGYLDTDDPLQVTAELIQRHKTGSGAIGLESNSWFLTPKNYMMLQEAIHPAQVVAVDELVAGLRLIKSEREIDFIRQAATITNAAVQAAAEAVTPGTTEREVAAVAFSTLVSRGSEYFGMEPFVASGPRAGIIHASWSDRVIQEGEGVLLEMSATKGRYNAPLMFTAWRGELDRESKHMAQTCIEARDQVVNLIQPGATPHEAHELCKSVIADAGLAHTYRKRSGYSVGLGFAPDWGEGHLLSLTTGDHRSFEPGMVVHVVPTLRIDAKVGQGFSATVLVTEDGNEILTKCDFQNEF